MDIFDSQLLLAVSDLLVAVELRFFSSRAVFPRSQQSTVCDVETKRCVFAIMITLSYEFFALRTLHRHFRDQITVAFSFSKHNHAGPLMFTDREQERHI